MLVACTTTPTNLTSAVRSSKLLRKRVPYLSRLFRVLIPVIFGNKEKSRQTQFMISHVCYPHGIFWVNCMTISSSPTVPPSFLDIFANQQNRLRWMPLLTQLQPQKMLMMMVVVFLLIWFKTWTRLFIFVLPYKPVLLSSCLQRLYISKYCFRFVACRDQCFVFLAQILRRCSSLSFLYVIRRQLQLLLCMSGGMEPRTV